MIKFNKNVLVFSLLLSVGWVKQSLAFDHISKASFREKINSLVKKYSSAKGFGTHHIKISFYDSNDSLKQNLLYELNETIGVRPASNLKLITTTLALEKFGPDYQFRTKIHVSKTPGHPTIVTIVGSGDPTWSPKFLTSTGYIDIKKKFLNFF